MMKKYSAPTLTVFALTLGVYGDYGAGAGGGGGGGGNGNGYGRGNGNGWAWGRWW